MHQLSNKSVPDSQQPRQAVFYEVFSCCAKLSQQMNLVGFESIPVDTSYKISQITCANVSQTAYHSHQTGSHPHGLSVWHRKQGS